MKCLWTSWQRLKRIPMCVLIHKPESLLTGQQLRKETDWLWEFHLLKDHPLYYDQCRERRGEVRTTGWRRMYKVSLYSKLPPDLTVSESARGPRTAKDKRGRQARAAVQRAGRSETSEKGGVCGQDDCSNSRKSRSRSSGRNGDCQSRTGSSYVTFFLVRIVS
jgi:hypothetical protein